MHAPHTLLLAGSRDRATIPRELYLSCAGCLLVLAGGGAENAILEVLLGTNANASTIKREKNIVLQTDTIGSGAGAAGSESLSM